MERIEHYAFNHLSLTLLAQTVDGMTLSRPQKTNKCDKNLPSTNLPIIQASIFLIKERYQSSQKS